MKKIVLLLLMLPLFVNAQTESKYMEGAVPEVDGKVVFTRHLNVSGFTQTQIFNALTDWTTRTFTSSASRIILTDASTGTIVAQNQNEIVARIGIFPGKVKMNSIIKIVCKDGFCVMETSRIRYTNNPASKKPTDIIVAEEYITDKYSMNKTRTKVHKGIGDYRIGTIDIVDKNALDAQTAIYTYNNAAINTYSQTMANVPAPTSAPASTYVPAPVQQIQAQQPTQVQQATPVQQPVQAQQVAAQPVPAQQPVQAQQVAAQPVQTQQPAQTQQVAAENRVSIAQDVADKLANGQYIAYITAVEGKELKSPVAGKGGLDLKAQAPAASFMVESDTDNILFIMEMADSYTITICKASDSNLESPVTILDCKKVQQFNTLFIGNIIGARVK